MIKTIEQFSSKSKVWLSEFQPKLEGLTLSWPAWSFWVRGQQYDVPADSVTFEPDERHNLYIKIWLSPRKEDGYLQLDVWPIDGIHEDDVPEPWPEMGHICLLWGRLVATAAEPDLQHLKHVEV